MAAALAGVVPVVHTPFHDDDSIDEAALEREVAWALATGAAGYATGMVSELLRLTTDERVRLTQLLAAWKPPGACFVAAVSAESTHQALRFASAAADAGCDGLMAAPPVASRQTSDELLAHFTALARATDLPLVIQDASSYVGQSISLDVYLQLLDRFGAEKILFKPEAAPLGPNLSALRDASGGRARILEGSGGIALVDSFRRGIVGTMPGIDLLPAIVGLWHALQQGDEGRTYRLYLPVCALIALQMQAGLDGFLAIEKYILVRRGIFPSDRRRGPLAWRLDDETRAEVDRLLALLDRELANL